MRFKIGPPVTHAGLALYLYAWAIFTTIMLVASLRTNGVLVAVFLLLTITSSCWRSEMPA